jgi:lauroyl/myristoyl acyltransferase
MLPTYLIREPNGRFAAVCGRPIRVDAARPADEAIRDATQAFASDLEARIRAHPQFWYQFYRYWEPARA